MLFSAQNSSFADAQDTAVIVLEAEAKLGDFLKAIPDFHSSGKGTMKRKELPENITKKESHVAQVVANNREVVEKVIEEAIQRAAAHVPRAAISIAWGTLLATNHSQEGRAIRNTKIIIVSQ